MGKHKERTCVFKCVTFSLRSSINGPQIQTDLYLTKNNSTITLQWCTFGGQTTPGQTTTTAQNQKIPCDFLPVCDQTFLISAQDASLAESKVMKLIITREGEITFVLSLNGDETPEFPIFDGSSVTWLSFNCSTVKC